jgi:hypothetical protein
VFRADVAKVDRDVAYVANVCFQCFICFSRHMLQACYLDNAYVSHICCKCFLDVAYVLQ